MSWKCKPVVGSSKMKSVPAFFALAIWAANFSRWDSPPESVVRGCPSRTYSSPTARSGYSPSFDFRQVLEELHSLGDRKIQNLANVFAAVGDFEYFFTVPAAVTLRARGVDVREKLHLDFFKAFAATGLAASAFDIERKCRWRVTAHARQIGGGEKPANGVEDFHIGRRIRARRGPYRRLIDQDDLGDLVDAFDLRAVGRCSRWELP